jgi:ATP-dependent Clp protease ATP-binding subunit ClpC
MFERFTQSSRRVVVLAQEEARNLDHNYIGTEHLLLGLLREHEGVAARALESLGITLEAVRREVEEVIGRGQQAPSGHMPFTPRAKKILELALREALGQGKNYIGTEHILLGLIREGDGLGVQILMKLGAPPEALRARVLELAAEEPDPAPEELAADVVFRRSPSSALRGPNFQLPADMISGYRRLFESVDRRLANIERHLGIAGGGSGGSGEAEDPKEVEDPGEGETTVE